jgi:hypothetical protein
MPKAYLLPARLKEIADLLRGQGIVVEVLTQTQHAEAQSFAVDSLSVAPLFEGHRTVQIDGRWSPEPRDTALSQGWYLVGTDQPLGTLAAYLLEPASEDGVVTWNLLDRELQTAAPYPILRLLTTPRFPAVALPWPGR